MSAVSFRPRPLASLLAGALILAAGGCGYTLVGRGGSFPQGVKTVAVASFKNGTTQYGLESKMSTALVQRIQSTGKAKVAPLAEADSRFEGVITGYVSSPIAYTASRVITQRRVTVTATVTFRVKGETTPAFSQEGITGKADFNVTGNLSRDAAAEKEAAVKALEDLVDKAVSSVVEGF